MSETLKSLEKIGQAAINSGGSNAVKRDDTLARSYLQSALSDYQNKSEGNSPVPVTSASDDYSAGMDYMKSISTPYSSASIPRRVSDFGVSAIQGAHDSLAGGLSAFKSGDDSKIDAYQKGANKLFDWLRSDQSKANIDFTNRRAQEFNAGVDARIASGEITRMQGELEKAGNRISDMDGFSLQNLIGQGVGDVATMLLLGKVGMGLNAASSFAEINNSIYDEVYKKDPQGNFAITHDYLLKNSPEYATAFNATGSEKEARDALYKSTSNSAMFSLGNVAAAGVDFFGDAAAAKGIKKVIPGSENMGYTKRLGTAVASQMASEVVADTTRTVTAGTEMNKTGVNTDSPWKDTGSGAVDSAIGALGASPISAVAEIGGGVEKPAEEGSKATKAAEAINNVEEAINNADDAGEVSNSRAEALNIVKSTMAWNDIEEGAASPGITKTLNGSTNLVDAVMRAGAAIKSPNTDLHDKLELALFIKDSLDAADNSLDPLEDYLINEPDSQVASMIGEYLANTEVLLEDAEISQAIKIAAEYAESLDTTVSQDAPVTEQKEQLDNVVTLAELNPEKSDPSKIDVVLAHAESGNYQLSSDQIGRLKVIRDTLSKARELDQTNADRGSNSAMDIVGRQIKSDLDEKGKGLSALGHSDKIIRAVRNGDTETASNQLNELGRFLTSQVNKLNALISSENLGGEPLHYKTTRTGGKGWVNSKSPVKYDAPSFAQNVQNETELLAATYNSLVNAFPELDQPAITTPKHRFGQVAANKNSSKQETESKPVEPTKGDKGGVNKLQDIVQEESIRNFEKDGQDVAPWEELPKEEAAPPKLENKATEPAKEEDPRKEVIKPLSKAKIANMADSDLDENLNRMLDLRDKDEDKYEGLDEAIIALEDELNNREQDVAIDQKISSLNDALTAAYETVGKVVEDGVNGSEEAMAKELSNTAVELSKELRALIKEHGSEITKRDTYKEAIKSFHDVLGTLTSKGYNSDGSAKKVEDKPEQAGSSKEQNTESKKVTIRKKEVTKEDKEPKVTIKPKKINLVGNPKKITEPVEVEESTVQTDSQVDNNTKDSEDSVDTDYDYDDKQDNDYFDRNGPDKSFMRSAVARFFTRSKKGSRFISDPNAFDTFMNDLKNHNESEDEEVGRLINAYHRLGRYVAKVVDSSIEDGLRKLEDKMSKQKFDKAFGKEKQDYERLQARKAKMDPSDYEMELNVLRLERVRRFAEGGLANFAHLDSKTGKLSIGTDVKGATAAAVLQWVVDAGTGNSYVKDITDLADAMDIPVFNLVDAAAEKGIEELILSSTSGNQAKEDISRSIMRMLGARPKSDSPMGRSIGPFESLAAQALTHLADAKNSPIGSSTIKVNIEENENVNPEYRDYVVVGPQPEFIESDAAKLFRKQPNLVNQSLLVDAPKPFAIGKPPKVSKTLLRDNGVQISDDQYEAAEFMQNTPYYVNGGMQNLLSNGLGEEGVITMSGEGEVDKTSHNILHYSAKQGRNIQIISAFGKMEQLMNELKDHSLSDTTPITNIPIYYPVEYSSVGRGQVGGSFNPQASKLMRSVSSPNRSVVNLENAVDKLKKKDFSNLTDNEKFFFLAMAQALDIKIHNQLFEDSYIQLSEVLSDLEDVATTLYNISQGTDKLNKSRIEEIMRTINKQGPEETPEPLDFLVVQALAEYGDLLANGGKDFTTHMYIEADGVTNGPFFAANILGMTINSPGWIEFVNNGGMYIGEGTKTLNEHRAERALESDAADNYTNLSMGASNRVNDSIKNRTARGFTPESRKMMEDHYDNVKELAGLLFSHIKVDDKGNIVLTRNTGKNPLTITIYGSGTAGIADNFASEMMDVLAEMGSKMIQAGSSMDKKLQAAFPDDTLEVAKEKYERLSYLLDSVTKQAVYLVPHPKSRDRLHTVLATSFLDLEGKTANMSSSFTRKGYSGVNLNRFGIDPMYLPKGTDFTNMQKNLEDVLVIPLVEELESRLPLVVSNGNKIVAMADMNDKLASAYFQDRLESIYKEKMKKAKEGVVNEDGSIEYLDYKYTDFLSKDEINGVLNELYDMGAIREVAGVTSSIIKKGKTAIQGVSSNYGRSVDGRLGSAKTEVKGVVKSGVGMIPRFVIGFGDARTIVKFAQLMKKNGVPNKQLEVFDGINLSADNFIEGSRLANEAVMDSIKATPLVGYDKQVKEFTNNLLIKHGLIEQKGDRYYIKEELLASRVASILYISHKNAGEFSKFLGGGRKGDDVTNFIKRGSYLEESANDMKRNIEMLDEAGWSVDQMASVGEAFSVPGSKKEDGEVKLKTSIRIGSEPLTKQDINTLTRELAKNTDIDRDTLINLSSYLKDNDIDLFVGVRSDLMKAADTMNSNELRLALSDQNNKGIFATINGKKVIMVPEVSAETLVHEVIHAKTVDTVTKYVNGELNDGPVKLSMDNLITLATELRDDPSYSDTLASDDMISLMGYLEDLDSENPSKRIKAISEYIAWVGSNANLRDEVKDRKVKSKLTSMIGKSWQLVKKILGITDLRDKQKQLYLDAFDFNARVVINLDSNSNPISKDIILNHRELPSSNKGLSDKIAQLVNTIEERVDILKVATDAIKSAEQASETSASFRAAGFNMTPEQQKLFEYTAATLGAGLDKDKKKKLGVQQLFTKAVRNLKPEDFLKDKENFTEQDMHEATNKYNAVTGAYNKGNTPTGRSQLLPNFLALSMISPEFQNILSKIKVENDVKSEGTGLDKQFSRLGNGLIYSLNNHVNGIKKGTVDKAVISLAGDLLKKSNGGRTKYESFVAPVGKLVDVANDALSDGMSYIGQKLVSKGDSIKESPDASKATTALANVLKVIGASIDKNQASAVAEGLSSYLNRSRAPEVVKTTIRDMIGRTGSNKRVYDLIKPVKSFIQRQREMFVEGVPTAINKAFTKPVTEDQWKNLHQVIGKTDLASLTFKYDHSSLTRLLNDSKNIKRRITNIENIIRKNETGAASKLISKSDQLANYMVTGKTGGNLLTSALAISKLFGEPEKGLLKGTNNESLIDELVTLKALDMSNLTTLRSLLRDEPEGMELLLGYMKGQLSEERSKDSDYLPSQVKGYIPVTTSGSLVVINDKDAAAYISKGYERVGDYAGSQLDNDRGTKGYYYSDISSTSPFAQGIIQTVISTINGVDTLTGHIRGTQTAGVITDDKHLNRISSRLRDDKTEYGLIPVYDNDGNLRGVNRALDPQMVTLTYDDTRLDKMLGVWRGRQSEEYTASKFNDVVLEELHTMYEEDSNSEEYINILDEDVLKADPVLADSVKLIDANLIKKGENLFGKGKFLVREDMIKDTLGYRSLTLGSLFDGVHRINPKIAKAITEGTTALIGDKAYYYLVKGGEILQNIVGDAKQLIVVKSVVVPAINALSNVYHMISRGVPLNSIGKGIRDKLVEVEHYTNSHKREVELEVLIRSSEGNLAKKRAYQAELTSIRDSYKDLSIYPLIESGEFSSIVSVAIDNESTELKKGKVAEYVERGINRLSPAGQDVAKNLFISKDTAIYQFLQKATDYGDFIAKAVVFDDLVSRRGMSKDEALGRIKEEFINYDVLPGRVRGALEKYGLAWFYNFKIRSVKIALSTIRENPLNALMVGMLPDATIVGNVGVPINDNVFYKLGEGTLPYSLGFGQGINSINLHPWINLTN